MCRVCDEDCGTSQGRSHHEKSCGVEGMFVYRVMLFRGVMMCDNLLKHLSVVSKMTRQDISHLQQQLDQKEDEVEVGAQRRKKSRTLQPRGFNMTRRMMDQLEYRDTKECGRGMTARASSSKPETMWF